MSALSNAAPVKAQMEAARLSLVANIFLVVIKMGAGVLSGSLSVLAEGVQSLLDIVASIVILVTVRAAAAPPDRAHPWGHGKFENMTSLGQMGGILISAGAIWWAAWQRWQQPVMPRLDWGAGAMLVAAGTNLFVSRRVKAVAKKTGSQALAAEAMHLRGDLWACLGVLLGLVTTRLTGIERLDPLIAAVMAVFVFISALNLLRDVLRPLVDEKLPADEESIIRAVLEGDRRVQSFHRLRTRRAGSYRMADVHILLPDTLSFITAHQISEDIEDAIRAALPNTDVIVHAEPYEEEIRHQREKHGEFGSGD